MLSFDMFEGNALVEKKGGPKKQAYAKDTKYKETREEAKKITLTKEEVDEINQIDMKTIINNQLGAGDFGLKVLEIQSLLNSQPLDYQFCYKYVKWCLSNGERKKAFVKVAQFGALSTTNVRKMVVRSAEQVVNLRLVKMGATSKTGAEVRGVITMSQVFSAVPELSTGIQAKFGGQTGGKNRIWSNFSLPVFPLTPNQLALWCSEMFNMLVLTSKYQLNYKLAQTLVTQIARQYKRCIEFAKIWEGNSRDYKEPKKNSVSAKMMAFKPEEIGVKVHPVLFPTHLKETYELLEAEVVAPTDTRIYEQFLKIYEGIKTV